MSGFRGLLEGSPRLINGTIIDRAAEHKPWMHEQEDRQPVKKVRDRDRAAAMAKLVLQYLPQYRFNASELGIFPLDVVESAEKVVKEPPQPPGLDYE